MSENIHINLLEEPNQSTTTVNASQSSKMMMMSDQLNSIIDKSENSSFKESNEDVNQSIPPLPIASQKDNSKDMMLKDKLIDNNNQNGEGNKGEEYNDIVISNPFLLTDQDLLENKLKSESNKEDIKEIKNTLYEPIIDTIKRDCFRIGKKLYYVLNPFSKQESRSKEILHWDLWGPLLFTIFLAFTLALNSTEAGQVFILVFFLIWGGSVLVYLNSNLLGSPLSIFNFICLLGYCLIPLNIISLIFALTSFHEILRSILILLACAWSSYSAIGFIKNSTTEDKQVLIIYPVILLYLFISGVILMTR